VVEARTDLEPSPALSIVRNGPDSIAGRRVGVLVSDGSDAKTIRSLRSAVEAEGAQLALVGPTRSGVTDGDGKELTIDEQVDGGPSVLFDAVAIVLSEDGARQMAVMPTARDFVTDAHAHSKFIGCGPGSDVLLTAAGITEDLRDEGYVELGRTKKSADGFVATCRALRLWDRELTR
jgi:catalase